MSPPTRSDGPRPKPVTRRTVLIRRDALSPDERTVASATIAMRAATELTDRLGASGTLGLYAPKGSEVDTASIDAFFRSQGFTIAYPRVVDDERTLEFHAARRDELAPSRFGLREPAADPRTIVPLTSIGAFVVPGLAFDRRGGRVGWGRGYYDATLAAVPEAHRIGLAFQCQLVDEVPLEAHDMRLHAVITEIASYP